MWIYKLEKTLILPIELSQAWSFLSDPSNLSRITPPELGFRITSEIPKQIYSGLIITYQVTPILNLPLTWVTEITQVREPYYFCDEQRMGPYRMWHHEHFLEPDPLGVKMRDIVHYALYLGPLAAPIHALVVKPQLNRIFSYREEVLRRIFPARL